MKIHANNYEAVIWFRIFQNEVKRLSYNKLKTPGTYKDYIKYNKWSPQTAAVIYNLKG